LEGKKKCLRKASDARNSFGFVYIRSAPSKFGAESKENTEGEGRLSKSATLGDVNLRNGKEFRQLSRDAILSREKNREENTTPGGDSGRGGGVSKGSQPKIGSGTPKGARMNGT